jgi:hypothetical protein
VWLEELLKVRDDSQMKLFASRDSIAKHVCEAKSYVKSTRRRKGSFSPSSYDAIRGHDYNLHFRKEWTNTMLWGYTEKEEICFIACLYVQSSKVAWFPLMKVL